MWFNYLIFFRILILLFYLAILSFIFLSYLLSNELAPLLTKRGLSLKMKGNLYDTYVRKVLMHGSETWPMKREDKQRMMRTEQSMVRRMGDV